MGFPALLDPVSQSKMVVSIPNRDLWVFRREFQAADIAIKADTAFQSLIGIYGFSGLRAFQNGLNFRRRFQSLIGIYGFSGLILS